MTARHTPGPWVRMGKSIGVSFGELATTWDVDGRSIDNARLIAAAPDLLEALQAIINDGIHCDVVPHLQDKARAAISKATGEPA